MKNEQLCAQVARAVAANWLGLGALVVCLALVPACSKGGGGGAPPQAGVPAPPVVSSQPPDLGGAGRTAKNEELDANSGTPANFKEVPAEPLRLNIRPDIRIVELDPTGKTPEEIFGGRARKMSAPLPGQEGVSVLDKSVRTPKGTRIGNDLFYSGSGQDTLYEDLKRIANESAHPRADRAFAERIGFTTFEVEPETQSALLRVTFEGEKGGEVEHSFRGRLDKHLHFTSGNLAKTPFILAEAVCMDEGGGCSTVHVRLKGKVMGATRTAHVIVRHTDAWIYSEGERENSGMNDSYDKFIHIMTTSAYNPGGTSSITGAFFNTSETINGPSRFAISLRMTMPVFDPVVAQAITWRGPLVKPRVGDEMDLPIRQYADYNLWGRPRVGASQLANQIRESRLVRNDGHGNLQIDVTFPKLVPEAREQTARITVARKHCLVGNIILR